MQRKQCTTRLRFLPLMLMIGLTPPALAQSTGESKETDQKQQEENVTAKPVSVDSSKKAGSIKAQSAKSADSYEATEEISEDLSVSYPVDI
ncbi:hypothetical protein [Microbulbifer pacificus]|uniref:hypothetical protein n=1 Tax=Microbulbifer pacificus TaxID=407164 RepID=UPI000CF37991|nr:hypothetical protein [Microbulbifer pacificus]